MTSLTRRSALTAFAAAPVAAVALPTIALAMKETPIEKVQRLSKELEAAMIAAYPDHDPRLISWGDHNPDDPYESGSHVVSMFMFPKVAS